MTASSPDLASMNAVPCALGTMAASTLDLWIRIILSCAFCALLIWSAVVHSPGVDEAAHLAAGVSHWEFCRFDLYAVNPPLARSVAAVPVICLGANTNWLGYSTVVADRPEFLLGRRFVEANGARSVLLFAWARVPLILIALLGLHLVMSVCNELGGLLMAWTGGVLYCTSPTVLGNGALVSPDLPAAVSGLLLVRVTYSLYHARTMWADLCIGVSAGVAILCKYTMIPVCISILTYAVAARWHASGLKLKTLPGNLTSALRMTLIMLLVIQAGFGWSGLWRRLDEFSFQSDLLRGAELQTGNVFSGTILGSIRCPLPEKLVEGIDVQKSDFDRGMRSYLMGEWKQSGWWYFYCVGFVVKEPLGFQIMLWISVLHCAWSGVTGKQTGVHYWHFIGGTALLILGVVSSHTGMSRHMRYLLPAYPFLLIIAARIVTIGSIWRRISVLCLIWQVTSALYFSPHWMSYFNEVAGGPANGHEWLIDSNIDWGQDILMLKKWQDQNPDVELRAALFSGFDPRDIGLKFRLPPPFLFNRPEIVDLAGMRGPEAGWYAVSVSQLRGQHFHVPEGNGRWIWSEGHFAYFLSSFTPVDRIGYSIYLYYISKEDALRIRETLLAKERRPMLESTK